MKIVKNQGIKQLEFSVLKNYGCVSPYHCDNEKQIYTMVNRCKNFDLIIFFKIATPSLIID